MVHKKKVLVAMSGGVDSSVTAALLKEEGHEVGGATMVTWPAEVSEKHHSHRCCGTKDIQDAQAVADRLRIPHWVFNFETEFRKTVVDEFAEEYRKGRTPNPCLTCNERIKFELFLERARQLGYEAIATGHYARIGFDSTKRMYFISTGKDFLKDQSYILYPLSQDVLENLVLRLGDYRKEEIRAIAKKWNLPVWLKADSQDICFVPDDDYGAFLERNYDLSAEKPALVRMKKNGKVVGAHAGYFHYTRGQRRGLGIACGERVYVVETDPEQNEVILGHREDILDRECEVVRLNWFLKPEIGEKVRAQVKVRSLHKKADATITLLEHNSVRVIFDEPQEAITKGQGAVFYQDECVLGGGRIEKIQQGSL